MRRRSRGCTSAGSRRRCTWRCPATLKLGPRRGDCAMFGAAQRAPAERPEELDDLPRQRLGLLHRREVAAARHLGPAPDVRVHALGHRARRADDLARERGVAHRHADAAFADRPRPVHARVVRPERGADRAGEPVQADVGEQVVAREHALHVAAAIGPGAELLDDPRGEPGRRIGEAEGERLRPRALDPLVAGLLLEPVLELAEVGASPRPSGRPIFGIAPQRQQVEVDADQLVGMHRAQPRGDERAPVAALRGEAPDSRARRSSARRSSRRSPPGRSAAARA